MSGTSEQWWEKKLNIKTSGMIDHFFEMDCNYYEPTDYFWMPWQKAAILQRRIIFLTTDAASGGQCSS